VKQTVFDRVERKIIAYKTPGRHVMHLESGYYGMSLKNK
jgi:hypothetical protein